MKLIPILLIFLISSMAFASPSKPFSRAFVMPGGGFNSAIFLGMYEALVEADQAPDLIISACGGSLAAPLVVSLEDPKRIKAFVRSKAYYQALQRVTINNGSVLSALSVVLKTIKERVVGSRLVPNLFENTLLNVPKDLLSANFPGFKNRFPTGHIRLIVLATRTNYGPQDVGSDTIPEYFETAFSDSGTAAFLRRSKAGPHLSGSGRSSLLAEDIEVRSGIPLEDAVRASIADPYYIEPMQIEGSSYITGAADLYPLELAHSLAREVAMPYPGKFDTFVEQNVFASIFGFKANQRLTEVRSQNAETWIDISDTDTFYKKMGMNPSPNYLKLSIQLGVPDTFENFQRVIDAQWAWGYLRAKEALSAPRGSKAHVRKP